MKSVAILVPKGPLMPGSIEGAFFLFQQANAYAQQRGRPVPFEVQLLGYAEASGLYGGTFSVQT
ncbi:MAG: hypothetical protein KDC44_13090, partial [Phaeodactylibacter sp.]|nr:hypothetical protein [Phaeodactylibacter sp.]